VISLFELFKIGIGPSSSHTPEPMNAAAQFQGALAAHLKRAAVARIQVTLFGSLAWTGKGHATEKAVVPGLMGCARETIDLEAADERFADLKSSQRLALAVGPALTFRPHPRRHIRSGPDFAGPFECRDVR
jgi:L-serine dehydratase